MSPMPPPMSLPLSRRVRTCFLSDIHLGFPGCRADYLLDFLAELDCETLYLVGDIVDFWSLKRRIYWPKAHHDVIRAVLERARCGTRVVYVPGNHDQPFREFAGWVLGQVEILAEAVHETADGRRFLVLHGDGFDSVIRASPLLETLGNHTYALVLRLNRYVDGVRRRLGYPYWSVAAFLKHKVGNAVRRRRASKATRSFPSTSGRERLCRSRSPMHTCGGFTERRRARWSQRRRCCDSCRSEGFAT